MAAVHRPIACVVSSCDDAVSWRRVLRFTEPGDRADGRLIAEVSIYLCDAHRDAGHALLQLEPFPPPDGPPR